MRTGGELGYREAKPVPERVMEPELPNRFLMRARMPGFAGFKDCQKLTQEAFGK